MSNSLVATMLVAYPSLSSTKLPKLVALSIAWTRPRRSLQTLISPLGKGRTISFTLAGISSIHSRPALAASLMWDCNST
jgi:hypothetical protein